MSTKDTECIALSSAGSTTESVCSSGVIEAGNSKVDHKNVVRIGIYTVGRSWRHFGCVNWIAGQFSVSMCLFQLNIDGPPKNLCIQIVVRTHFSDHDISVQCVNVERDCF